MLDSFPENEKLTEVLKAHGSANATQQLCLSLLHNWLQLPDPLAFEEHSLSLLLDEFADAVLKNRITTKSRFAIESLTIANPPILLEESMLICKEPNSRCSSLFTIIFYHNNCDVPSTYKISVHSAVVGSDNLISQYIIIRNGETLL